MIALIILISLATGLAAGFALCYLGTWARVYRQESNIRALINNIQVAKVMETEVPTEWVLGQLETMLVKEFR